MGKGDKCQGEKLEACIRSQLYATVAHSVQHCSEEGDHGLQAEVSRACQHFCAER
jgi:hypothetical protein